MAYTVVTGSRRNPQRSAATGTPIRLESQWPLYYGMVTPTVSTSTVPTTTTEEDTSDTTSEVGFAGAGGSPIGSEMDTSGLGPDTAVDALAYDIQSERYGITQGLRDLGLTVQGPLGLGLTALNFAKERARAYDLAQQQLDAQQADPEGGAAPGYGPSDLSHGGMRQTETGGWGFTGASEDTQGISTSIGDFDGAYGSFGFGMGKGTGDVGDTGYGGGTDSGAGVGGVGAGTNSYGGGYSGGYGMDAGIGRSGGYGDDNEGGMGGTGSGGLGGLG